MENKNSEVTKVTIDDYTMDINKETVEQLFYLCLGKKTMREDVDKVVSFILDLWQEFEKKMSEHQTMNMLKILNQIKLDYKTLDCIRIENNLDKTWE